jgi:hypothetical protein
MTFLKEKNIRNNKETLQKDYNMLAIHNSIPGK